MAESASSTDESLQLARNPDGSARSKRILGHVTPFLRTDASIPEIIVVHSGKMRARFLDFLDRNKKKLHVTTVIDTEKYCPQLLFIKTPEPEQLFLALAANPVIARNTVGIFFCHGVVSEMENIGHAFPEFTGRAIRVACFPSRDARAIAEALPKTCHAVVHGFDYILFAVFAYKKWYVGFSPPKYLLSDFRKALLGQEAKTNAISRAFFKVQEVFTDRLPAGYQLPDQFVVADLGAAPGGWTHYFAMQPQCKTVLAIDPGAIQDSVLAYPSVKHIAKLFEDCDEEFEQYGPLDIVVCDINMEPSTLPAIFLQLSRFMKPGAMLVWTCKGRTQRGARNSVAKGTLLDELAPAFERLDLFHLVANSLSERTVIGWKRANPDAKAMQEVIVASKAAAAESLKVALEMKRREAADPPPGSQRKRKQPRVSGAASIGEPIDSKASVPAVSSVEES